MRQYTPQDVFAPLHALLCDAFAFMEGRIDPPSSLNRLSVSGLKDKSMTDEIWVIEENNTPVAYMILTPVPDALYLGKVAVAQSHRGLGLARVMVDHAQRRAQEMNRTTLRLETRIELIENHLAFAALGFHKTSETAHRGYDSPTGIAMERPVPPR